MVHSDPPPWTRPELSASSYSIKAEFAGSEVLLTGASGYIGSVVLEQLLRTTDVGRVHLLLRPRKGQSIQDRAHKLLQGALFHKVREDSSLLSKVVVVGGDISLPGLGLSPSDRAALSSSVNFIIHCAADIRLEADIQETLTSNYEGTRTVLELAASAQRLRGLVHVSSAFVNMNMPRGSIIDEAVYPLRLGRQVVDVEQIAKELLESGKAEANQRAETYKQLWNFPNTYTLGKHMGEQLVTRYQAQLQLAVAIVRPSLTSAIAGEPYPGYVGNWAGPIGAAAAMAVGMFDALPSVASQPTGVWDVVPADLVASSILAAAAAVSAGAAAAISQATQSGAVQGTLEERRVVLGYPHPLSAAVRGVGPQLLGKDRTHDPGDVAARILAKVKLGDSTDSADAGRISPRSDDVSAERDQRPHQHSVLYRSNSSGSSSGSERLLASAVHGGKSEEVTNSSRSSSVTGCECGVQQLAEQQGGVQQQGGMPLLILHSATSSTYPLVLMESWNYMLDFLEAHRAPFRMTFGKLQRMTADFEPNTAAVMSARRRVGWKVWALAGLMRLMGKEREARKLEVGFDAFCVQNNSKTDRQLVFSTDALVALEASLDPSEAAEYMLVWRPVTNRGVTTASRDHDREISAAAAAKSQLAPVHGDLTWKRYLNTQMAGVYKAVFGVEVPPRQPTAAAAAALAAAPGMELREEDYIVHDFRRIR